MLLSVENISLHFGKRRILDDVSLKLDEGMIIALTGKSGSGKTSLLGIDLFIRIYRSISTDECSPYRTVLAFSDTALHVPFKG